MEPQPTDSKKTRRLRKEVLVFALPNLFTTANLFFGFFSVISSIRGDWTTAAWAIILAGISDGLDGRVARMTNAQSAFGEQYDSMSDLISFGMAPAVLMFQWALAPYGRLGWLVAFMYLACAALRLARFNVLKQSTEKRYFQGLPSPLAAGTVATAVLFYADRHFEAGRSIYMLAVMAILAAVMISTVRYRSFKDLKFNSQTSFATLFMVIGLIVLLCAAPETLMFPISAFYVLIGPLAELTRLLRRHFSWIPGKGRN